MVGGSNEQTNENPSKHWGKTRTKIPDGAVTQVGHFPLFNGYVDLEL